MAEPNTVNIGLIIPSTGSLVDTWGELALNPDFVAIDGLFAGVATVSLTNVNVTLTAPAGSITPSAGPTQSQNAVLRFTGLLTGNVLVTLPLPGRYIIENRTTGNFVVTFRGAVAATEIIAIDQGNTATVYNDGSNVRFVDMGKVGDMEFWVGLTAIPAWVTACTKNPYLICDGSAVSYNFSDYPYLGNRMQGNFGGNGITTFGIPDMAGRVPLAYDRTGTRITTAGSGINGQTMGASNGAIDAQKNTLAANQIPTLTSVNASQAITVSTSGGTQIPQTPNTVTSQSIGGGASGIAPVSNSTWSGISSLSQTNSISVAYTNASQQVVNNVQPAQVAGIWVIRAG